MERLVDTLRSSPLEYRLRTLCSRSEPGTRVPDTRTLAGRYNSSERTVRRALERLAREGLLRRIPGKGTFVADVHGENTPPPSSGAAGTLYDHLREQIASGYLKQGDPLPQVKLMRIQFGLANTTVSRAYRALERHGLATRVGKRWRVGTMPRLLRPATLRRAVVYNMTEYDFRVMFSRSALNTPGYRSMERELHAHGFGVEYRGREEFAAAFAPGSPDEALPDIAVCAVVATSDYDDVVQLIRRRLRRAARGRTRVLIVTGASRRPPSGILQLVSGHINTMRARRCAEFLHRLRIHRATLFHRTVNASMWQLLVMLKTQAELDKLDASVDLQCAIVLNEQWRSAREYVEAFEKHFRTQGDHLERVFGRKRAAHLAQWGEEWFATHDIEQAFQACRQSDIWVFQYGRDAARALEWLDKRGIAVPGDLSVMSLEDREEFFHLGLTTCAPDWHTIGYLMAHALIGDIPVARTSHGYLRTEALVWRRRTTR